MLAEFGREISPFKFSGEACGQGSGFCRFLREALLHSASFEILMFRFFLQRVFAIKFYFMPLAGCGFSARLKF
ncbi:hypothetical protein [uncultured Campylobacter sp.]|uniref:hypothetical protein n=1 Tax=uncultured Campylobacter sp. TaxID=218934 RepID=UPI0026286753|nr:hypothetical protein [uncultured Campylobacter sp.]